MSTTDIPKLSNASPHRRARLRQPGPRACAEPARLRPRRGRRPAPGRPDLAQGARPTASPWSSRPKRCKGADLVAVLTPDMVQPTLYAEVDRAEHQARRRAAVRARLQRALRPDRAARGHRRDPGRAERARRAGAHANTSAAAACRACMRCTRTPAARPKRRRAGLRRRHRRRARDADRNRLQGRDRNRPVRRAGRALRRRQRAGAARLRDPGRGRLPAGDRLLRSDARAEADRRPVLRGRPDQDAEFVSETAQYGDYVSGPRVVDAGTKAAHEGRARPTSRTAPSRANWTAEYEAGLPNYKRLQAGGSGPSDREGRRRAARAHAVAAGEACQLRRRRR